MKKSSSGRMLAILVIVCSLIAMTVGLASAETSIVCWKFPHGLNQDLACVFSRYYYGEQVALPTGSEPGEIFVVWSYDEDAAEWKFFNPRWPIEDSTLQSLEPGKTYLVIVQDACNWEIPYGETLAVVLAKEDWESIEFHQLWQGPEGSIVLQHVWSKGSKMRIDMTVGGVTNIIIRDGDADVMYQYIPEENIAYECPFHGRTPAEDMQNVLQSNPVVLGTENEAGKECMIINYVDNNIEYKMWVWKEKGVPIRYEITDTQGTMVLEYRNFKWVEISDSVFELPPDVEILLCPD